MFSPRRGAAQTRGSMGARGAVRGLAASLLCHVVQALWYRRCCVVICWRPLIQALCIVLSSSALVSPIQLGQRLQWRLQFISGAVLGAALGCG